MEKKYKDSDVYAVRLHQKGSRTGPEGWIDEEVLLPESSRASVADSVVSITKCHSEHAKRFVRMSGKEMNAIREKLSSKQQEFSVDYLTEESHSLKVFELDEEAKRELAKGFEWNGLKFSASVEAQSEIYRALAHKILPITLSTSAGNGRGHTVSREEDLRAISKKLSDHVVATTESLRAKRILLDEQRKERWRKWGWGTPQ